MQPGAGGCREKKMKTNWKRREERGEIQTPESDGQKVVLKSKRRREKGGENGHNKIRACGPIIP